MLPVAQTFLILFLGCIFLLYLFSSILSSLPSLSALPLYLFSSLLHPSLPLSLSRCRTAWSTRSACSSTLTSRATRWRSRRMTFLPCGRMASPTGWAAWGSPEECEYTHPHTHTHTHTHTNTQTHAQTHSCSLGVVICSNFHSNWYKWDRRSR